MVRCAREDISKNHARMPGQEATEEVWDYTTRYQREGLFIFYRLMWPLCDTPLSGIREDKRPLYYYEVDKWQNIYAYQIGLGGSYTMVLKILIFLELFAIMDAL